MTSDSTQSRLGVAVRCWRPLAREERGGLEQVGGILTGDPITRAEGEFNAEVGSIHQESNKNLTAIDEHLPSEKTNPAASEDN